MPDFLNEENPDPAHEAFRLSVLDHIAQLADHLERLDDSFLLALTAADFAQTVLTNFGALQQVVGANQADIATLKSQVATLQSQVVTLQSQVAGLLPPI